MKWNRSTWIGAAVGLLLGMPLFEILLLLVLVIDAEWFDRAHTLRYFSSSRNLLLLLGLIHLFTGSVGAVVGAVLHHSRTRRRFRVLTPSSSAE